MNQPSNAVRPFDARTRTSFGNWTHHTIRYNDQDTLGHVNNAVYSTFFEAGRTSFIEPMMREVGAEAKSLDFVLARVTIDFIAELSYPGAVDIGTHVLRLGNKSITFGNGIFNEGHDTCVATCEAVLVFFDLDTRTSVAPPAALRAMIENSMIEAE